MPQMDEFGKHEVLHMSLVLSEMVDLYLLEHEQIKNNPEWYKKALTACEVLNTLYQEIAVDHLAEDEDGNAKRT